MSARPHPLFAPDDLAAIGAATQRAESRTSGEIVPYSVERCDHYAVADWRAAATGAIALAAIVALIHLQVDAWGVGISWLLGTPIAGAIVGLALAKIPAVRRSLVGVAELERMAHLRAKSAFVEEEVFVTRERTGILIFLALFEHRVVILADSGINAQVRPEEWHAMSDVLARGIRERRAAAALIQTIDSCGELLTRREVVRRDDDTDELSNKLRIRED